MNGKMNLEALAFALSHDLRAAPRRVEAFAGLLRESLGPQAGSEATKLLDSIDSNAREMSVMLEDLMGLVRLAVVPCNREAVDLEKVVRDAWQDLQSSGRAGKCTLQLAKLEPVSGDRALLRHAVEHLLSNAAKFSAAHELPQVEVGTSVEGTETHFFVRDNGVGFNERYAERLFRPFSRLHSARDFAGRGMGLAVVDLVVSRHGGRAWASSTPGQGARFNFTLPAAVAA